MPADSGNTSDSGEFMPQPNWNETHAALSDKSARIEYGLEQHEIIAAIRDGSLQFRENHSHGNPYFRLLRHEVEALVEVLYGPDGLSERKLKYELKSVESQIRSHKSKLRKLEKQKSEIQAKFEAR